MDVSQQGAWLPRFDDRFDRRYTVGSVCSSGGVPSLPVIKKKQKKTQNNHSLYLWEKLEKNVIVEASPVQQPWQPPASRCVPPASKSGMRFAEHHSISESLLKTRCLSYLLRFFFFFFTFFLFIVIIYCWLCCCYWHKKYWHSSCLVFLLLL